jgi:hypothetical protein
VGAKRRSFDPEFRAGVHIVKETGKPVARVARDLGMCTRRTTWVKADRESGPSGAPSPRSAPLPDSPRIPRAPSPSQAFPVPWDETASPQLTRVPTGGNSQDARSRSEASPGDALSVRGRRTACHDVTSCRLRRRARAVTFPPTDGGTTCHHRGTRRADVPDAAAPFWPPPCSR